MWCCWLLLLSGPIAGAKPQPADDVAGPIVKLSDISAIEEEPPGQPSNATSHTIAQVIDQALQKEFKEDTDKADSDVGKTFNETSKKDEASAGLAGAPGARQSLHALPSAPPPAPLPASRCTGGFGSGFAKPTNPAASGATSAAGRRGVAHRRGSILTSGIPTSPAVP